MVKSKRVNPLRKKSKSITSKNHKIMYGGVSIDEKGLAVDIRDILNMLRDRGDSIIIKPELTIPPNNVTAISLINQIIHNDDSRSDHGHKNELGDKLANRTIILSSGIGNNSQATSIVTKELNNLFLL